MNVLLDTALAYAVRGWPVLPLRPGAKVPATAHGCHDATTDPERIARWWGRHPDHGVGIATGHGIDVIDVDGWAGADTLERLAGTGDWPVGPVALTGRCGWHVYVQSTGRGNAAGIVPEVDYRGLGGYVVAPPSSTTGTYMWSPAFPPDLPIPPCPGWLLDAWDRRKATPQPTSTATSAVEGTAYGRGALDRELGRLALVAEGARNDELCRSSYRLGQLVAGGELDARAVAGALLVVAQRTGLGETEAVATIRSGLAGGMRSPRTSTETSR